MKSIYVKKFLVLVLLFLLLPAPALAAPAFHGSASISLEIPPSFEGMNASSPFIRYDQLDEYGRATCAVGLLGPELIAGERAPMSGLYPAGWRSDAYSFIDGNFVYNRCHLIGHQFAGAEGAENIITGTRFLNVQGMLPYENQVADYIQRTRHHVFYRATASYSGSNLLCDGVTLEAQSVEDNEIRFVVWCFNVQPGIAIDYRTGMNRLAETSADISEEEYRAAKLIGKSDEDHAYVLNTKSMRFHKPECSGARDMKEANRQDYYGSRSKLIEEGYQPCGTCKP